MCCSSECMEKAWQGKIYPTAKVVDCSSVTEMLFLIIREDSDYPHWETARSFFSPIISS